MSRVDLHEGGLLHVPSNWIRRFLIESIYRRLSKSAFHTGRRFRTIFNTRSQLSRSLRLPSGPVPLMSKWSFRFPNYIPILNFCVLLGSSVLASPLRYEYEIYGIMPRVNFRRFCRTLRTRLTVVYHRNTVDNRTHLQ